MGSSDHISIGIELNDILFDEEENDTLFGGGDSLYGGEGQDYINMDDDSIEIIGNYDAYIDDVM